MDIQRIEVPFEIKQQNELDKFYELIGYANIFDIVDFGNDRAIKGMFEESIIELRSLASIIKGTKYKSLLPALWQHKIVEPVGAYIELKEDSSGLFVHCLLPKADTFVQGRVIPQVHVGSVGKLSIGYIVKDFVMEMGVRNLLKVDLKEISLVTFAMNNESRIIDVKKATTFQDLPLADRSRPWNSGAARSRVRTFLNSTESPSSTYKRAFMWYDQSDEENFGAYKLPYADVVDNRLVAIPRAIFAIAGVLRGARGGVNIPDSDMAAVVRHVNRYYSKMDLESPLQKKMSFRVDDISTLSEREFELLLQDGVHFTQKGAKLLITKLKVLLLSRDEEENEEILNKSIESISDDDYIREVCGTDIKDFNKGLDEILHSLTT